MNAADNPSRGKPVDDHAVDATWQVLSHYPVELKSLQTPIQRADAEEEAEEEGFDGALLDALLAEEAPPS